MKDKKIADGWVRCPECSEKTRLKVLPQTKIENLPLFCPKCKRTTMVDIKENRIFY